MLPQVEFHHNARDPLALARELIAEAVAGGRKVAVRLEDLPSLRRLDQLLWTQGPLSFLPHVTVDSDLAAETPVVLGCSEQARPWPHADMLINLAAGLAPDFTTFRTVVEIVGPGEAATLSARKRWMSYKQQGLVPQAIDAERRAAP